MNSCKLLFNFSYILYSKMPKADRNAYLRVGTSSRIKDYEMTD